MTINNIDYGDMTKEFISEILGEEISNIGKGNDGIISYWVQNGEYIKNINADVFSRKCKEWALRKGYQFQIYIYCDRSTGVLIGESGMGWKVHSLTTSGSWEIEAAIYIYNKNKQEDKHNKQEDVLHRDITHQWIDSNKITANQMHKMVQDFYLNKIREHYDTEKDVGEIYERLRKK